MYLEAEGDGTHLVDHRPEAPSERGELGERLLEDGGEGEEAQGVAGRGGVEDDDRVLHRLDVLHDLREPHRLVHAWDREGEVLHERTHRAALRFGCQKGGVREGECARREGRSERGARTLLDHLLYAARRVDLHGAEVVEAVDLGRLLAELLPKGVGEVVRRVGADEQHRLAVLRQLDRQRGRGRRLAHAAFPADEDPLERLLLEDVDQRWLERFFGRHCCRGEGDVERPLKERGWLYAALRRVEREAGAASTLVGGRQEECN